MVMCSGCGRVRLLANQAAAFATSAVGIGAFLTAIIIKEMGYSSLEANLRTAPIYMD